LVGAGTGIVGITLAILRSTLDLEDHGSIVTTDLRACPPLNPRPIPLTRIDSLCDTHSTRQRYLQSAPDEQMHSPSSRLRLGTRGTSTASSSSIRGRTGRHRVRGFLVVRDDTVFV
jgi:hypothetical protein